LGEGQDDCRSNSNISGRLVGKKSSGKGEELGGGFRVTLFCECWSQNRDAGETGKKREVDPRGDALTGKREIKGKGRRSKFGFRPSERVKHRADA